MLPLESGVTVAEKKPPLITAAFPLIVKERFIFYICSKMTDPKNFGTATTKQKLTEMER